MNLLTTTPCSPQTFKRPGAERGLAGWLRMLGLAFMSAAAVLGRRSRGEAEPLEAVDALDDAEWEDTQETMIATPARPAPRDWLFWSFFMFMAVAALPLVGIRWSMPEGASMECAFEDAVLLALPVVIPLPFLLVGCAGSLAFHSPSRTPPAIATFGFAMLIGLAAAHAVLA